MRLPGLFAAALLAVGVPLSAGAQAPSYPSRPVTLIVTYGAGGSADSIARIIAPAMSEALGQNIVVENRPGGGGVMGSDMTARATPDGYTIQMSAVSTHAIAKQFFGPKLPYDPEKSFTPIGLVVKQPNLLLIGNHVPANTVAEFIAWAKKQPSLLYGTAGVGTSPHLVGAMLGEVYGIKMEMVPYRSSNLALADVVAGQIPAAIDALVTSTALINDKRIKAVALTSLNRSDMLPGVPTFSESGAPGLDMTSWNSLSGPAGMPDPVVRKLNAAMNKALQDPSVRKKFLDMGCELVGGTPEEFAAFMAVEVPKWSKAVVLSGAKAE